MLRPAARPPRRPADRSATARPPAGRGRGAAASTLTATTLTMIKVIETTSPRRTRDRRNRRPPFRRARRRHIAPQLPVLPAQSPGAVADDHERRPSSAGGRASGCRSAPSAPVAELRRWSAARLLSAANSRVISSLRRRIRDPPVRHQQRAGAGIEEGARQSGQAIAARSRVRAGGVAGRQDDEIGIELEIHDLAGRQRPVVLDVGNAAAERDPRRAATARSSS